MLEYMAIYAIDSKIQKQNKSDPLNLLVNKLNENQSSNSLITVKSIRTIPITNMNLNSIETWANKSEEIKVNIFLKIYF